MKEWRVCTQCQRGYDYDKERPAGNHPKLCGKCYKREYKKKVLQRLGELKCMACGYNKYTKNLNKYFSPKLDRDIILCRNCAVEARDLKKILKERPPENIL